MYNSIRTIITKPSISDDTTSGVEQNYKIKLEPHRRVFANETRLCFSKQYVAQNVSWMNGSSNMPSHWWANLILMSLCPLHSSQFYTNALSALYETDLCVGYSHSVQYNSNEIKSNKKFTAKLHNIFKKTIDFGNTIV